MRILHVNKFLYRRGGAESYMLDLARLQADAGHTVEFFAMAHPDNLPSRYAAHFPGHVELEPPPARPDQRVAATTRMLWSPEARRGMDHVLEAFNPDIVHLHNIYHQLSPSVLRPLAERQVPAVMTLHDYKLVCPTYLLLAQGRVCEACLDGHFRHAVSRRCKGGSLGASAVLALESAVHRRARAYDPVQVFICISRFQAGKMAEGGVYPDRLALLPGFVDTRGLSPRAGPGSGIVYAGRLSSEKGVDVLIEAVGRLRASRLELVGDGPERGRLEALAAARAPGRVGFHGRVPRERVLELVSAAAVAVMPSRCHDNQPMAILEAFACGVPVVATSLGGMPELTEGGAGVTVPPDDPDALAGAVGRLLRDSAAAAAMGRAARARAEQAFSPDRHLAGLERLYARAARKLAA